MPSIEDLKSNGIKKDKGNMITETDYVLRKKSPADIGVNTIIMDDTSLAKHSELIKEIKETLKADKAAK